MDPRFPPDTAQSLSSPAILVYSAFTIYAAYFTLRYFDLAVLSPQEYCWNALVWILPEPLILDAARRQELRANDLLSQRHAAKSGALRRMLGLGGNAILQSLPSTEGISMGGIMRRASMSLVGGRSGPVMSDAPAGLGNWDNSCYQNSVLQALSSLGSLRAWLPAFEPPCLDGGMATNTSLQEMIAKLRDPGNNGRHIWTPAKLKNMSSWQQQDAQEYFSKIMDELDKEAARAVAAKTVKPGLEAVLKGRQREILSEAESREKVAAHNPLEGLAAQRVSCTSCGFSEGFSMIPFNCLTVPLGSNHVYDLAECLDEYTKSEDIEGVECRSCTLLHTEARLKQLSLPPELRGQIASRLQAIQQALENDDFSDNTLKQECQIPAKAYVSSTKSREGLIGRAPQSLAIHVNRSVFDEMTGMQRKNYAHVRYPLILDLGPWMLGTEHIPTRYRLSAVVTHYGRHENGHYICYRRHPRAEAAEEAVEDDDTPQKDSHGKESWWRLSDEDVSQVEQDTVLDQGGVFMLFYEILPEPRMPAALQQQDSLVEAASTVPLPPDEAADWDFAGAPPSSTATPSLATSTAASVVSESDTDFTDVEESLPEAKPAVPAPVLKTAGPSFLPSARKDELKHGLSMNRSLMSV